MKLQRATTEQLCWKPILIPSCCAALVVSNQARTGGRDGRVVHQFISQVEWLTANGSTSKEMTLYGKLQTVTYKTFLATYRPAGGLIRVVIVKRSSELFGDAQVKWVAFFCTDPDISVQTILECVADRSAIEQNFHDVKEIHGATDG